MSFRSLLGGVLAGASVLTTLMLVASPAPALAAPAVGSCGASSAPVVVHFVASTDRSHHGLLSAVDLSGFSAACEGASAVFQLWGNPAGDPSVPQSGDSLLAALDSTIDPCKQEALAVPLSVQHGDLGLTLCPRGGPAGEVSIHDLTFVALFVNGQLVPVDSPGMRPPSLTSSPAVSNRLSTLAFTGTDVELLALAGMGAVALGSVVILLIRRRERHRTFGRVTK